MTLPEGSIEHRRQRHAACYEKMLTAGVPST